MGIEASQSYAEDPLKSSGKEVVGGRARRGIRVYAGRGSGTGAMVIGDPGSDQFGKGGGGRR